MFIPFYNKSIRNLVVAFGSLFNNIRIQKKNSSGTPTLEYVVPISYGPKERFIRMLNEPNSNDDGTTVIQTTWPRMNFQLSGAAYDPGRKQNSLVKKQMTIAEEDTTKTYSYVEVPYNFTFTLDIASRTIDEGLQILEQILPYFSPGFTVSLNMTSINTKVDVPVVLRSVAPTEEYIGDGETKRTLAWTLVFDAKSFVYGPTKNIGLIEEATVNLLDWSLLEE